VEESAEGGQPTDGGGGETGKERGNPQWPRNRLEITQRITLKTSTHRNHAWLKRGEKNCSGNPAADLAVKRGRVSQSLLVRVGQCSWRKAI